MTLTAFLEKIKHNPTSVTFADTIAIIEKYYNFSPTAFVNGQQHNAAGENSGSCQLFAFAKIQQLNESETLACFGAYYFDDVMNNPTGNNHQNIRNFMQTGWKGIAFEGIALTLKP
ncbi:HopJ type III effector protein [Flavobacterium branchiophilum]|uniref:Type III effector n=1 Tax=Flavobacterium branchiophilum TaxID=55197 RepID=A0A2H3KKQ5_9FLAO|nr:HopJ type III effector protein [Flavobacterium branchiophilum]PDS23391.1 type III effector [Flavobacterium branchiophilum]